MHVRGSNSRMAPSSMASLFFLCLQLLLLLPASHGASSHHASYKLGSRQVFFKTPAGRSPQASTVPTDATTCSSSITTGQEGNKKIPVVHRQSPCSPLHGLPSLSAADVLRRDTSHVRRRFASSQSSAFTAALAPAPSPAASIIPVNGSSDPHTLPGELDYSVVVGYGTPEQQLPMFLDTSIGTTLVRCQPCAAADNCDLTFDTSRSSTFTHVACGSPDCPTNCSGDTICPYDNPNIPIPMEGMFAKDVLKLTPSMAVDDFKFVCMDMRPPVDLPEAGFLDLSRDSNSLPSRLSSPSAAFSYCLPHSPSSQGFLSLGNGARNGNNRAVHASLMSNDDPELAILYFIDVVGMSLGGEDLPMPAGTFSSNTSTILEVGITFTMLAPDVYTALHDAFRKEMLQYNRSVPGFAGFDTCFNFTGLHELDIPLVRFKFGNGESLLLDGDQMLYYDDPTAGPFTMACLAFSAIDDDVGDVVSAVIGTYTLASTEVVYDVAQGKVGLIPLSC